MTTEISVMYGSEKVKTLKVAVAAIYHQQIGQGVGLTPYQFWVSITQQREGS